jgi:hypothetical protein
VHFALLKTIEVHVKLIASQLAHIHRPKLLLFEDRAIFTPQQKDIAIIWLHSHVTAAMHTRPLIELNGHGKYITCKYSSYRNTFSNQRRQMFD